MSGRLVLGAIAVVALTHALDPFHNYQVAMIAAYLCATAGLTVLIGQSGQLSLGHGAVMAVGAYTLVLLQNALVGNPWGITSGWTLVAAVLGAVAVSAVAGLLLGLAAARLRGPYLAGVTLALAVVVEPVAALFPGVLGGDQGLHLPVPAPPPSLVGWYFPREQWHAWLSLLAALVTLLVLGNLARGRYGRRLRAVRDDEAAARLAGIPVGRTRVLAFSVSSAAAGLGGAMVAIVTQGASPGAFSLTLSLYLLLAVVLGGLGSLAGAAWGAALIVLLPSWVADLAEVVTPDPALRQRLEGNLPLALFGLTLVIVCIAAPRGIRGLFRKVGRR